MTLNYNEYRRGPIELLLQEWSKQCLLLCDQSAVSVANSSNICVGAGNVREEGHMRGYEISLWGTTREMCEILRCS
jgi:hypothetical protein